MLRSAVVEVSTPMLAVTVPTFLALAFINPPARPFTEHVEFVLEIQGQTLGFAYGMWLVSLLVVTFLWRKRLASVRAKARAWTLFGSLAINPVLIVGIVIHEQIEFGVYIAFIGVFLGIPVFGAGFLVTFFVARHIERQSAARSDVLTSGPAGER